MSTEDEFEAVRADPDPIRRGQRATELITTYQQRATELARLRKAAIEQARRESGMSYVEIASALGISKGRVTQIKQTAAEEQRVLFGVGPVNIGIPYRYQTTDRSRPLIAAEDSETGDGLERLLSSLAFTVDRFHVAPETDELPHGDVVIVCGPKSSPVADELLAEDPVATLEQDDNRWWFKHRTSSERTGSPTDADDPVNADIGYFARHRYADRVVVHIAGIHAIGSLGVVHYLTANLPDLFNQVGDVSFSMAVRATYDGMSIVHSERVAGPYVW